MRAIACIGAAIAAIALAVAPAQSVATDAPPSATTGSPTAVTATSATLGGTVNPNGTATTYVFQYGASTAYGAQTGSVAAGAGTAAANASATVTGLTPDTTYHFRVVATSSGGTIYGADAAFTTSKAPPIVATGGATTVTSSTAALTATVNPNGRATNYQFQYGTTTSYGLDTDAASAGAGTSAVSVKSAVSGLSPGRTYHFRVIATNPDGTTSGADATFVTVASPPAATTGSPTEVTSTTAVLTGQVNPQGRQTSYAFEYGSATSYGSQTSYASAGSGTGLTSVKATVTGLAAGAAYHYRLVATSGEGTGTGADAGFVTTVGARAASAPLPVVSGAAAVRIAPSSAQLNGAINPSASHTTWYFQYGLSTAYGLQTAAQSMSGLGARPVNVTLAGLEPGTTFHFRLVAQSGSTLYVGPDATFATKPAIRLAPGRLGLAASSVVRRGAATVAVSGALAPPPSVAAASACSGTVEIQIVRGADTISLRSEPLSATCTFGERVSFSAARLGRARRLEVIAHFTGNAALLPGGAVRASAPG